MIDDRELLQEAIAAMEHSYSPYSGHPVGAALLAASGRVYRGTNVENASYGLTICAERVAVVKAVSEGERDFLKIALACGGRGFCRPCGACRQFLFEFAPEIEVVMGNARGEYEVQGLRELLLEPFKGAGLKRSDRG